MTGVELLSSAPEGRFARAESPVVCRHLKGGSVKRDPGALDSQSFDVLVIGGGLVGASVARDAARRGLSVALVERDDFGCGASRALPRLVLGAVGHHMPRGIGSLRRMFAEAAAWRRIAPHRVEPQPCVVPLSGGNSMRNAAMRFAFDLYRWAGSSAFPYMESHTARLGAAEAVDLEPALDHPTLRGALVYPDWRIDEPERMVLALLKDAAANGAVVVNHVECDSLILLNGKLSGARLFDRIGGFWLEAWSSVVVNATGAWSDAVAARMLGEGRGAGMRLSREIRIIAPAVAADHALVVAESNGHDLTIVPWQGMSVVGAAVEPFDGDPAAADAGADDIARLAERVGRILPAARDGLASPIDGFAAVRSLPRAPEEAAAWAHLGGVTDHAGDGVAGFLSVGGGEWTTVRPLAERAVDRVVTMVGRTARACDTGRAQLSETVDDDLDAFVAECRQGNPYWPDGEIEAWVSSYGVALPDVIARAGPAFRPGEQAREAARFAYAQDEEMAVLPDDFVRRLAHWYELSRPGVAGRAAEWLAGRREASDPETWETGS